MKVTPDIIRQEFIGTEGKITESTHFGYIGIRGKVIDETRNTFTILHKRKAKSVVKNMAVFNFKFIDGTIVEIDGRLLVGRAEDRIKKTVKRLW
ncbi:ribonuclease P protein subunit [Candidatus Bathyarchaeota archaeon]|nr:ribonuclease P protein subunit [Candidatus Bathyarchaeota archaeon]